MRITLDDDSRPEVHICDQHAEEATVRTAREAYLKRQTDIAALMEQAKALGLTLQEPTSPGGLVIARQTAPPSQPPPSRPQVAPLLGDDTPLVNTALLDRGMVSVGGSVDGTHVPSFASHDLNSVSMDPEQRRQIAAARQGKAKVQLVEGRAGIPVALPAMRQDGLGTTVIRIVKSNDQRLQDRFKQMADSSKADAGPDFRNGYDAAQERSCPVCGGRGSLSTGREKSETCPKCEGSGIVVI